MSGFPQSWAVTGHELLADGVGGTVWRVRRADAPDAIAKRLSPAAAAEAGPAQAWLSGQDGRGAVRLLAVADGWQLLEDAGDRTLTAVLDADGDDAAARIAAEALRALHGADYAAEGLTILFDRLGPLRQAGRREGGPFADAAARAQRLSARARRARPLHGDLHHDNLLHGPRGWLAIDPHGVFGDPTYDAANLLYNPVERADLRTNPARARRMADILAPVVDDAAEAVLEWAVCHACLSAAWHLEDANRAEAVHSLGVAAAVRQVLEAG